MAELDKKWMSRETMIHQIMQTLYLGTPSDLPAYTLILGSGASHGSVPTAREMLGVTENGTIHEKSIPAYLHTRKGNAWPADLKAQEDLVTQFWKDYPAHVEEAQPFRDWLLNHSSGKAPSTPQHVAAAYKALFEPSQAGGLNSPAEARRYLRAITLGEDGRVRLNGTHFFLASLLALQSTPSNINPHYGNRRPFARTLFTTNFDPLLQVSLQLFQVLYYMTDRPELLPPDALATDDHPAVHLFYAHGSVHRPFLANADGEIGHLKDRNAQNLSAYLSQHGVIVLGYSGWDDCLLEALNQCTSFSHNLYWLCRGESSLTGPVKDFLLSHPNAYCVDIKDGSEFMSQLHGSLCPGVRYTELLNNPIPFLQRRLEQVDLQGIAAPESSPPDQPPSAATSPASPTMGQSTPPDALPPEERRTLVVELLAEASTHFEAALKEGKTLPGLKLRADQAYDNDDWPAVVDLYTKLLDRSSTPTERAQARLQRAYAHGQQGDFTKEIEDYTQLIAPKDAPTDQVAIALFNRGNTHRKQGDIAKAIEDYTQLIALKDAPIHQVANALCNRGVTHGQQGDITKEIEDYTQLIALKYVPVDLVAKVLFNRGLAHGRKDDMAKAIEDYTQLIALKHAPIDHVTKALFNRGRTYREQGDIAKEIADYTELTSLKDAPVDHVTKALFNRGVAHYQQGDITQAIEDYTQLIALIDAPTDQVANALFNRGIAHYQQGDHTKAIEDFTQSITLTDASVDQVADALFNRSLAHVRQSDFAKAIEDFTQLIALIDAPTDQVAKALFNRGIVHSQLGNFTKAIEDFTQLIALKDAPVDQVANALFYRGIAHGKLGDIAKSIEDFTQLIALKNAPIDQVANALFYRGNVYLKQNDTALATADFSALLALPECPAELTQAATAALSLLTLPATALPAPQKMRSTRPAKKTTPRKRSK
ncbi:tetratricopeptide repeat protein [Verrucomicrobium sp. BvORR106]|uniref:tetratricopeptide repeat protein n=1 Tax=Verrucomicrobium sp. BvORR106 TaxID=1403819 RepID=UPI000571A8DE|nr:tetratricopeptide repeat protein [Verrucomicrobium sp. BvORR106]